MAGIAPTTLSISDLSSHDRFLGVLELPFNLDNKILKLVWQK